MAENITYIGKKVFIGIDVHKRYYVAACVSAGMVVKRARMVAGWETMLQFVKKYFPGAEVSTVYEAGFSGFGLQRYLEKHVLKSIVVNASSVQIAARDKVKTDKRDAAKLAQQLEAGLLKGVRVPSEEEENYRLITRTRAQHVRQRQRIMNQVRMKFHQFGLLDPEDWKKLSFKKVQAVLNQPISEELRLSVGSLMVIWKAINGQVRVLDKQLEAQAQLDTLEKTYRTIPGIGPLTARILSHELGDMKQFANERALFSFTGLTPQEFSTGEHRRLGHISRQGSSRLRHTLVELAWRAIKKDRSLAKDFERIAARKGKKRAIVAIARKLIGKVRAVFRSNTSYEVNYKLAA